MLACKGHCAYIILHCKCINICGRNSKISYVHTRCQYYTLMVDCCENILNSLEVQKVLLSVHTYIHTHVVVKCCPRGVCGIEGAKRASAV